MSKVAYGILALTSVGCTLAGPVLATKTKVGVALPLTGNLTKFGGIGNKR